MSFTIKTITTKSSDSIEFYKDINTMNHVLNEYIFPEKLVAVSRLSDDGLQLITDLTFDSIDSFREFLNDPVIQKFSKDKKIYNDNNNITYVTESTH